MPSSRVQLRALPRRVSCSIAAGLKMSRPLFKRIRVPNRRIQSRKHTPLSEWTNRAPTVPQVMGTPIGNFAPARCSTPVQSSPDTIESAQRTTTTLTSFWRPWLSPVDQSNSEPAPESSAPLHTTAPVSPSVQAHLIQS